MQSMYAVNLDNTDELKSEYKTTIAEVEKLLEIADPERTPFKSKYDARYWNLFAARMNLCIM